MVVRKKLGRNLRPNNIFAAVRLCIDRATEQRRPYKVVADKMGISEDKLYRWVAEGTIPTHSIRPFEEACGFTYISDYLVMARENKIVITIPTGKNASVADLAELQGTFADVMTLLVRCYQRGEAVAGTVEALSQTILQLVYQRSNVLKMEEPEFDIFGSEL